MDDANYELLSTNDIHISVRHTEFVNFTKARSISRRRRIGCSFCLLLILFLVLFSSRFRPFSVFYNEKDILGKMPPKPACIVIVPVTVSRTVYRNTLHHLELALTDPCVVIVSEDTSF